MSIFEFFYSLGEFLELESKELTFIGALFRNQVETRKRIASYISKNFHIAYDKSFDATLAAFPPQSLGKIIFNNIPRLKEEFSEHEIQHQIRIFASTVNIDNDEGHCLKIIESNGTKGLFQNVWEKRNITSKKIKVEYVGNPDFYKNISADFFDFMLVAQDEIEEEYVKNILKIDPFIHLLVYTEKGRSKIISRGIRTTYLSKLTNLESNFLEGLIRTREEIVKNCLIFFSKGSNEFVTKLNYHNKQKQNISDLLESHIKFSTLSRTDIDAYFSSIALRVGIDFYHEGMSHLSKNMSNQLVVKIWNPLFHIYDDTNFLLYQRPMNELSIKLSYAPQEQDPLSIQKPLNLEMPSSLAENFLIRKIRYFH